MKSVAHPARRGFTLVELLMVITIIGMLMALLVAGAMRAVVTAKTARVTVEVGMLDTAMQNYKNEIGGAYPPDFTFLGTTATAVNARNNRILAHLRKAFPRFYVSGYGAGNQQGTLQYAVQQAFAQYNAAQPAGMPQYFNQNTGTFVTPNGVSTWGDLNNLDAAEALVFWLGGLPDVPVQDLQTKLWAYRMKGFSANKLQPFNLVDASRLKGPFEWQDQRLGDADGDGWPEFYPQVDSVPQPTNSGVTSVGNPTSPYVYFDAGSYTNVTAAAGAYPNSAQYPSGMSGMPANAYAAQWGAAIPYAKAFGPNNLQWMNPEKFQIVSAGLDSQYYFGPNPNAFRVFPGGTNYSQADMDNVTNFSNGKLQDSIP